MAIFTIDHPLAFSVGILGNIISLMVFFTPLTTFYRIYKKKSTEEFQSVPYVVALFSCMLWIYYALLKSEAYLLISINSLGCAIEIAYLAVFLIYAPKKARLLTAKILLLLNGGLFSLIFLASFFLAKGSTRVHILGWICVGFATCVFAAPLSIIRLVIKTKSVEFMPFSLSLFLTFSAVVWFAYGLLLKDIFIVLPNVLGFVFGVLQMVLYVIYMNHKIDLAVDENKKAEHILIDIVKIGTLSGNEIHPIENEANLCTDQKVDEQTDRKEELSECEI